MDFRLPTEAEFTKAAVINAWYYDNSYSRFDEALQQKLFPGNGRVQVNYGEGQDSLGNIVRESNADGYLGLYGMLRNALVSGWP